MRRIGTILLMVLLLTSCANQKAEIRRFFAMDTYMELTAYGQKADGALQQAEEEIKRLDILLDRSGDGEIALINQTGEGVLSEDGAKILHAAFTLAEETEGAFDPTIAPVIDAWGFYKSEPRVPDKTILDSAVQRVGYTQVELQEKTVQTNGAELDLGGIAKGYASDQVCRLLREKGISSAIISLGGNIQTVGKKPDGTLWKVAVADPEYPKENACAIEVENKAVITSGGYQRNFVQKGISYHHILNPHTGMPAETEVLSVTVIGEEGTLCDGLSTALYVMGLEQGTAFWREHEGFDVIFITKDTLYHTPGVIPLSAEKRAVVCLKP